MGTVLHCTRKGEDAAVKMIRPNLLGNDDIRGRFAREAELLQSVNHPNVARIVGYDATNKTSPWLATEFIDGPNLREWVADNGPMAEAPWEDLAKGVLDGLAAIHATGILHRDIKPANIMMSPHGPKIIDFGISKEEGQTALTNTQMFAGTVAYLAPERVERNEESQASDMFSVGLVLAVAARGSHPWGDETTQTELSILMSMATDDPRLEGLTRKQESLLRALLQRQPHLRPTASEAAKILSGELDIPVEKTPKRSPRQRRTTRPKKAVRHFTADLSGAIVRGVSVAGVAFVTAYLAGLLFGGEKGFERVTEALSLATQGFSNALRLFPVQTDLNWLLSSTDNITTTLSLRPTLLTLGLAVIFFVLGRKYAPAVALMAPAAGVARLAALIGPIVALAVILSWFVPEASGMMPWDGLFAIMILFVAAGLGLISGGFAHENSDARWWLQALTTFGVVMGLLSAAVIIGGVIHGILTPDFALATRSSSPGVLGNPTVLDVFFLVVFALFFLPNIVALSLDGLLTGQGYGAFRENELIYLQLLSQPADTAAPFFFSQQSAILAALFFVALLTAGLVAGSRTATLRDKYHHDGKSFARLAILGVPLALLLFGVFRVGVDAIPQLRGSFLLNTSVTQTLIVAGLTVAGALAVTLAIWVGGHHRVASNIAGFIPGLPAMVGSDLVPLSAKKPFPAKRITGFAVIAVSTIVTLIIPPGIGLVERSWATLQTPEAAVNDLALAVEIRDGQELTRLLPAARNAPWLPHKALEEAQPMVGQKREISVSNDLGLEWKVGQLDGTAVVSWPTESGNVRWTVPLTGEVTKRFIFMRHATYTPDPQPLALTISADSRLGPIPGAPILVNGETVASGTYSLIPGVYTVERGGIDLVAPFTETFEVSASEHAVFVPVELKLPSGADQNLNRAARAAAEECGNVRRSACFTADDVYSAQKVISGRIPSSFFSRESTPLKDAGLHCTAGEDELISTSEIVRPVWCTQTVSYETKYWDSRQIADPVFSRRCASWWYSWWFGSSCLRWETYQSGTNYRTVRGSLIDTVRYRSEMPVRVAVPAGLDEGGAFIIGDAQLN